MSRMAVCYFCGTVVDSPDPTPLLPPSLRVGDGPTVDLCGECAEKYGAVRQTVAEAVDAAPADTSDESVDAAPAESDESVDAAPADTSDESVDAPEADDGLDGITIGSDDAETNASESEAAAENETDDAANGDAADDAFADVSVSKADFRRVLRLLENRDLPVERREIETVASNAYDIPESTCAAILDAAAERGHVGIEGDRIVAAE